MRAGTRNREPGTRPLWHDGYGIFFDEPLTPREARWWRWGNLALGVGAIAVFVAVVVAASVGIDVVGGARP